jgi:hypothetical protein
MSSFYDTGEVYCSTTIENTHGGVLYKTAFIGNAYLLVRRDRSKKVGTGVCTRWHGESTTSDASKRCSSNADMAAMAPNPEGQHGPAVRLSPAKLEATSCKKKFPAKLEATSCDYLLNLRSYHTTGEHLAATLVPIGTERPTVSERPPRINANLPGLL